MKYFESCFIGAVGAILVIAIVAMVAVVVLGERRPEPPPAVDYATTHGLGYRP